MTLSIETVDTLDGATVHVNTVRHHHDSPDYGVTGTVVALDTVGVLLQLVSGAGDTWIERDAGRLRFLPWTSVEHLTLLEHAERPSEVDSTRPLP